MPTSVVIVFGFNPSIVHLGSSYQGIFAISTTLNSFWRRARSANFLAQLRLRGRRCNIIGMAKTRAAAYVVRDPNWIAVKTGSRYLFVKAEDRVEINTSHPGELTWLLDQVTTPIPRKQLESSVATPARLAPAAEIQGWIEQLKDGNILLQGTESELLEKLEGFITFAPAEKFCKHVVFCVTGSVQASAIGPSINKLVTDFAERVDLVVTAAAERFFNPEVFSRMGVRVWRSRTETHGEVRIPHVQLARTADLVLVFPASAASLSRIAQGSCTDLVSTIAIGARGPVVIVPAMNTVMWNSPAVRRNIETVTKDGFYVVHPGPGVALADAKAPRVELGNSGVRLDRLEDLPYLLMHLMAVHAESR
jgi:3-polyprenyl-4-hydroxybenzoate decarboxylase